MKKIVLLAIVVSVIIGSVNAQDEDQAEKGFKKEKLFTGGSITVSFYSGGLILGGTPMFGYQLAPWVDAGVVLNYTYQGSRDVYVLNDKVHQHVFGPGVFTRIYPLKFLFAQGQLEHNFTSIKYSDPYGTSLKENNDANSLLVGGGIAQGRERGSNSFFYFTILFDVLKNRYSPYVNNIYDSNGELLRTDMIPIFRAGVNIALFQKSYNGGNEERGSGRKQPKSYDRY